MKKAIETSIFALFGSNGTGREEPHKFRAKWEFVASKINGLKEEQRNV